jgi:hypothetical protein
MMENYIFIIFLLKQLTETAIIRHATWFFPAQKKVVMETIRPKKVEVPILFQGQLPHNCDF